MGQYHKAYNIDKREFINPHNINCGLKLHEQMGFDHSTSSALFLLIANSNGRGGGDAEAHPLIGTWAGDRVVVQGDYAEETDRGFIPEAESKTYKDISGAVDEMLTKVFG